MIALAFFWVSVILIGYGHFGYPVLMRAWAVLRPRRAHAGRHDPAVSVLVVVHNEAARIDARIVNLLALDYPKDRLEIVVGSDGSTDDTAARASTVEKAGVPGLGF